MATRTKTRFDPNQIMFAFDDLGLDSKPSQPVYSGDAKDRQEATVEKSRIEFHSVVEAPAPPLKPLTPEIQEVREAASSAIEAPATMPVATPVPTPVVEIAPKPQEAVFSKLPKNEMFEGILEDVVRRQDMMTVDEQGRSLATYLISQNRLSEVRDDFITPDVLSVQDHAGNTPVHWAAALGRLETLPDDAVNADVQQILNKDGKNFLHVAEASNQLKKVPEAYFDDAAALQMDSKGKTVFDYASQSGQIKHVPRDVRPPEYNERIEKPVSKKSVRKAKDTFENEFGETVRTDKPATWNIPTEKLTTPDLMVQDEYGRTVLERVFDNNEGALLQPGVLTEDALMVKDKERHNMLFIIADKAGMHKYDLPESVASVVTEKTLRTKTIHGGYTPAHVLAGNGQLSRLPAEAVTDWVLNMKDDRGNTVIECAENYAKATGKPFVRPVAEARGNGWDAPTVPSPDVSPDVHAQVSHPTPEYGIGL